MLVQPRKISFPASGSPDVQGYKLYFGLDPIVPDYNSTTVVDLGALTPDTFGNIEIDLAALSQLASTDGLYNIGVTAYDEVRNESAFTRAQLNLDFVAPDAPGPITVL